MSIAAATAIPHFQVFRCRDTDEQAAVLHGWNQSYCQLSPGAFDGSVTAIDTGAVHIVVEHLNRAVLQRGALSTGCVAIGVPLQLDGHSLLCGQRSHINGLHVFSGADGFEFRSPEKHVVVDIEFYPQRFANPALREALPDLPGLLNWPVDRWVLGISRKRFLAWASGHPDLPAAERDILTARAHRQAQDLGYRQFRTHTGPRPQVRAAVPACRRCVP